jgi:hypothetical protein
MIPMLNSMMKTSMVKVNIVNKMEKRKRRRKVQVKVIVMIFYDLQLLFFGIVYLFQKR